MADLTPKIGLKKPDPNVESDWGFRLNETIDILDDAMLTTNVSGVGSITVTDDGSGNVTISGTDEVGAGSFIPNALVGSDGITVTSGDPTDDIAGFRGEFVATSGSLQDQLDAITAGDVESVNVQTGAITITGTTGVNTATAGSVITLTSEDSEIDHDALLNFESDEHFTEASIDHTAIQNIGSNSHASIDTHIADGTLHFTEGSIDHTAIQNIGDNTHAEIDTHLGALSASGVATDAQVDTNRTEFVNASGSLQTQIDAVEASDVDSVNAVTGAVLVTGTAGVISTTVGQTITLSSDASGIDHGDLSGLGDDDHTQYSLVDGTRAFTGLVTIEAHGLDITNSGIAVDGGFGSDLGFVFVDDRNTGMGSSSTGRLDFSSEGNQKLTITDSSILAKQAPFHTFRNATASAPDYSFALSSDTGMYSIGFAELAFTASGTKRVTISGTANSTQGMGIDGNLTITGTVLASSGTFTDGLTVGTDTVTITPEVLTAPTGTFADSLTVSGVPVDIAGITTDHAALNNLDFASAGHTGFGSSADTDALAASGVATDANIVSVSGHLQGEIDSIDASVTLQEAYDNGDGTIASTSSKPVQTGDLTATGTLFFADGDEDNPSLGLASDTDTGFYKSASNEISVTTAGNQNACFGLLFFRSFGPILTMEGSRFAPGYTFTGNTTTGLFSKSTSVLGITAGTTEILTASGVGDSTDGVGINGNLTVTGTVKADIGTFDTGLTVSGLPVDIAGITTDHGALTGLSDDDHTQYSLVDGTRAFTGLVTIEAHGLDITNSGIAVDGGFASRPGFSFVDDRNTGMFHFTDDILRFSAGGIERLSASTTEILARRPYMTFRTTGATIPDYSFFTDSDTGVYRPGADIVALTAGGTKTLTVSGVNDGTDGVGIDGNLTVTGTIAGSAITAVTGTFTDGLTVGTDTVTISPEVITAPTGTFEQSLTVSGIPVSLSDVEGITDIVQDLTPQLGGDLDVNGFDITSTTTIGLSAGTGELTVSGVGDSTDGVGIEGNLTVTGTVGAETVRATNSFFSEELLVGPPLIAIMSVTSDQVLFTVPTKMATFGGPSAPDYSFLFGATSGMYSFGFGGGLGFATGGIEAMTINKSTQIVDIPIGLTAVTGTFTDGLTVGTDTLTLTPEGITTATGTFTSSLTVSGIPISLSSTEGIADTFVAQTDGTINNPAFAFASNPDVGMFLNSTNDLRFIQNGVSFLRFTSGRFIVNGPIQLEDPGSAALPAFTWEGDNNTGIYQLMSGDNSIAFSTNATQAGFFDSNQDFHVTNDVLAGGTISGSTGTYDDGLTVSGVPVATGTVVDEGQIVFLAQMFG